MFRMNFYIRKLFGQFGEENCFSLKQISFLLELTNFKITRKKNGTKITLQVLFENMNFCLNHPD